MQIGRRLYFDIATGEVIFSTPEQEGAVVELTIEEDFERYPALQGKSSDSLGVKQLEFGERKEEIINMGSWMVDPVTEELIIYPRIQLSCDRTEIPNDGQTAAVFTATLADDSEVVSFTVNSGTPCIVSPLSGAAIFEFTSTVPGDYVIEADAGKFGRAMLGVTVNA